MYCRGGPAAEMISIGVLFDTFAGQLHHDLDFQGHVALR